ncbi:hypothetical protein HBI71_230990 [Parastagonospora nodorum]|nr:hypothetical protein HBI71_230990 [Parastagonospora nodorum]
MLFTNIVIPVLVAFLPSALAQSNAIVSLALSTNSTCSSTPTTFEMETNRCYSFGDTKGMRVTHHSPGATYNTLRVFTTANCDAGQDWKYVELDGGACENVEMYKAYLVKLRD